MMKKLLAALLLLASSIAFGQTPGAGVCNNASLVLPASTLPAPFVPTITASPQSNYWKIPNAPGFAACSGNCNGVNNGYYANDSSLPTIMSKDGFNVLVFMGDGWASRLSGPNLESLYGPVLKTGTGPLGNQVPNVGTGGISYTGGINVTAGPNFSNYGNATGPYNYTGSWMQSVARTSDGWLVALVHGENHIFAQPSPFNGSNVGQWESTAIWISKDDGINWVDQGIIVGTPQAAQPLITSNGVIGQGGTVDEITWDPINQRWFGFMGNAPRASWDPHAMPGTWYAMDKCGNFTISTLPNSGWAGTDQKLPSMDPNVVSYGNITWNTFLGEFVYTFISNGKNYVNAAFSRDGMHWSPVVALFKPESYVTAATYSTLLGDNYNDQVTGRSNTLSVELQPAKSGRNKDMVTSQIVFGIPAGITPTNTTLPTTPP